MTDKEFHSTFFDFAEQDGAMVVRLNREQLTDDENLEQLDHELNQILGAQAGQKLVCDLTSVKYLNSSAIGKLISLHRKSIRIHSQIILCGLQPTVKEILGTSHLLQYFSISEDAEAAITEFK